MVNELRAGAPIMVAGTTLIPVERVWTRSEAYPFGYWLGIGKEAFAVVICDLEGPRAVDIEARELPLDEFAAQVRGLESLLADVLSS